MSFLSLSPELVLNVSSFLRQVDLLNLSLVCQRIRDVTEPELFREYTNTKLNGRSFRPFIRKIIERPELGKYVRKLELRIWETVENLNPRYFETINGPSNEAQSKAQFDKHCKEISEEEYDVFTEAAKANGCIVDIFPYERKSFVITAARQLLCQDVEEEFWFDHIFDKDICFSDLPYDRIFCQMLRAGLEEPLVTLLVALLPMVKEILLCGVPGEPTALRWRANHGFKNLREMVASGCDGEGIYPIAFFNPVFASCRLESFRALSTSSWSVDPGTHDPESFQLRPLSLPPRSLNLKIIELRWSVLTPPELRKLLEACHELKVLRYTSASMPSDETSAAPAEIIELLRPFQDSLEELMLSFEDDDFMEYDQDDLIYSVKHMTSLKCLSVPPECFWATGELDYDEGEEEASRRPYGRGLSNRLPPNLEELALPLSTLQEYAAVEQIQDIIVNQAKALPHLSNLYIGANDEDEEYRDSVVQMIEETKRFMNEYPENLAVMSGAEEWRSVFDTLIPSRKQPFMRWFGSKYAYRQRKPNRFQRAMQIVTDRYKNQGLNDAEIAESYKDDPDFQAACAETFGPENNREREEIEYYSQDEEGWNKYSYKVI